MGIATYEFKKHVSVTVMPKHYGLTLENLNWLMTQLPVETTIISIEELPIIDLSTRWKISLRNAIFIDGAVIENNPSRYIRETGITEKNEVKQFDHSGVFKLENVINREFNNEEEE